MKTIPVGVGGMASVNGFCIHEYSIYIVISQSIYDMNYLKEETTNDTFLTSFIDYNTEGQSQKASKNYNILLLYDKQQ